MATIGQSYLVWTTKAGEERLLRFDAILAEHHSLKATATEHPVEKGVDLTDHIRKNLDELTLEVFVTNAPVHTEDLTKKAGTSRGSNFVSVPLDVPAYEPPLELTPGSLFNAVGGALSSLLGGKVEYNARVLKFDNEFNNVSDTLRILRGIKDTSQLLEVYTPNWQYPKMVLLSIDFPRAVGEGGSGKMTLQFKALRIIETKQTADPIPTEVRGQQAVKKGAKGPEVLKEDKGSSVLRKGLDASGATKGITDLAKKFGFFE